MDGARGEIRQELCLLNARFVVAFLLDVFSLYYGGKAGFDTSDSNPGTKTKTGGVAFFCASELNKLARLCFLMVVFKIVIVPVVVERMRRTREECDTNLVAGCIFLLISLLFSAYLRWFIVA